MQPKYSIAIINYNMADTLEQSLKSILDQLDERFEVLVVDDGSTDGSQEILNKLEQQYEIFRWIEGNNKNRGEARNQAVRESKGENIITGVDCDDKYQEYLQAAVNIYERVNRKSPKDVHIHFKGFNILSSEIAEKHNFKPVHRMEDNDQVRRVMADAEFDYIDLGSKKIWHELGHPNQDKFESYSRLEVLQGNYCDARGNLKAGVTLTSYISYRLRKFLKYRYIDDLFRILVSIPLRLKTAKERSEMEAPQRVMSFLDLNREFTGEKLCETYNIDKSDLTLEEKELLKIKNS